MPNEEHTLEYNKEKHEWDLKNNKSEEVEAHFKTQINATRRGGIAKFLGEKGGSVRIQNPRGGFQGNFRSKGIK